MSRGGWELAGNMNADRNSPCEHRGRLDVEGQWGEAGWRVTAEWMPHIVWVASLDGRTVYLNRRGLDYTGVAPAEITWRDLVHPDDLAQTMGRWMEAVRAGEPFKADYRVRRYDGVYLWHAVRSEPVRDVNGDVVRWLGTAVEIQDRKELESELVAAERRAVEAATLLETLQAAAPVGLGFIDRDLRVVHLNEAMEPFTNVPADHHVGRSVAEVVPELWPDLESVSRRVLAGEPVLNLPFTRPAAAPEDAPTEWVANLYPVRVGDDVVGVGLVVVDITERVLAEGFRTAVMSQIGEGVLTQDLQGRLTYMNRAASRLLGWAEEELRGRPVHDALHPPRPDGSPACGHDCRLRTETANGDAEADARGSFTRRDGTVFPVCFSSVPLRVGTDVQAISVVFRDLSYPDGATRLIRVLIADAVHGPKGALEAVLTRHDGFEVVATVTRSHSAIEEAKRLSPDVVLVDVHLPGPGWSETVKGIQEVAPRTAALLLIDSDDEAVVTAAIALGCAGAADRRRAWVDLASTVRAAHHGEMAISLAQLQKVVTTIRNGPQAHRAQDLTAREREVLTCLSQGLSNQQAAVRLGVTQNTVRNHVQRVLYKLDVHSRLEAVVLATREGLLDEP
ncbi:MAG: PAS domain S-box protein [Acidimicrobiales bacterium]|nr:PAS domain S-box protein [Acidimicrobiales bacterium]